MCFRRFGITVCGLSVLALGIGGIASIAAESPKPKLIAFTSEFAGQLLVMDVATRAVKETSVSLGQVDELAYSPTLGMLAFSGSPDSGASDDVTTHDLYTLTVPGGVLTRLPTAQSGHNELYRPKFDPAGEFLYAVNYFAGIYRYSLSRNLWTQVKVEGANDFHPQGLSFSPSGKLVAVSPGDFKGFLIGDVEPDRLTIKRAVLDNFDSCISASWINESTLVFAGRQKPGLQFLWTLNLASGELRQLTHPPMGSRDFLSLSADRSQVAFTGSRDGEPLDWGIWVLPLDSSEPIKLTTKKDDESFLFPAWLD